MARPFSPTHALPAAGSDSILKQIPADHPSITVRPEYVMNQIPQNPVFSRGISPTSECPATITEPTATQDQRNKENQNRSSRNDGALVEDAA
uniref:Uncharacterized protein n=1 Tax=Bracon brevicornis TaxID=1563983 RepID=A0A6V7JWT9_9HYME